MTLAELGHRTGYSAAQVSRFERGLAPLTDIAVLRRFAEALALAPQILGLADAPLISSPPNGHGVVPGRSGNEARPGIGAAESVKPYADRGLVTREQWNGIIHGATREPWLYGMAEYGYASDDDVPAILTRATARGCKVRVLLLNPNSPESAGIDRDEGNPAGTLAARTAGRARAVRRHAAHRQQLAHVRVPRRRGTEDVHPLRPAFREHLEKRGGLAPMTDTDTTQASSMKDARLIETEILLPKPKRFVRESLEMPDGYRCDLPRPEDP